MPSDVGDGLRYQPRAAETRERLLAAAVEVFAEFGYPGTGLADIAGRAYQTTGAVYYHFASKEGLALAVIANGHRKMMAEVNRCLDLSGPGLENVIVMSFNVFRMMQQDTSMLVATNLNQAFGQLHADGRRMFGEHVDEFLRRVVGALDDADLCGGLDAEQVANLVWMALQGSHQLARVPMGDGVDVDRLAVVWAVILRSTVSAGSLAYFEQFVARAAQRYQPVDDDQQLGHHYSAAPHRPVA